MWQALSPFAVRKMAQRSANPPQGEEERGLHTTNLFGHHTLIQTFEFEPLSVCKGGEAVPTASHLGARLPRGGQRDGEARGDEGRVGR